MTRLIHAHPIERLVDAYLKRLDKTFNIRKERQILVKASFLIGAALLDPCCPGGDPVAPGNAENFFIVQLRGLLNGIDVRANRQSLLRAKAAIDAKLHSPCCEIVVVSEPLGEFDPDSVRTYFCGLLTGLITDSGSTMQQIAAALNVAKVGNDNFNGIFTYNEGARTVTWTGTIKLCAAPQFGFTIV